MTEPTGIFSDLKVECHAGYRGDECPRRIYFGRMQVEVTNIIDRWIAPDHRYFKVEDDEGNEYILRHDSVAGRWELTSFKTREHR